MKRFEDQELGPDDMINQIRPEEPFHDALKSFDEEDKENEGHPPHPL